MRKSFGVSTLVWAVLWGTVAGAASMKIDEDGMAVVDGARTFILGLYENPEDDGVLKEAVQSGLNLIYAAPTVAALDRLGAAGAWAWLNTGASIDFSDDQVARQEHLESLYSTLGGHPALAVWEVPDEALWNTWYLAQGWRHEEEPKQQLARIASLTDPARAAQLTGQVSEAQALNHRGNYAAGEAMADAIWVALGESIPKPGYGLSTAPERVKRMGDGMLAGYSFLRALDGDHPIWMNHAPRNTLTDLAYFNRAADIVGCDIYPVPEDLDVKHSDLGNRSLASVGDYTQRMQAAAPGKPVWMVLQGTGWDDFRDVKPGKKPLRRPSKAESRFMAYDAIVQGARGILYWGSAYVEKDSDFWKELLEVIAELDRLQPVLTAPDATSQPQVSIAPSYGSGERGVEVLSKACPEGDWLLVVNRWSEPLTATITGFATADASAYRVFETSESLPVAAGGVTVSLSRYSVLVLAPVSKE